MRLLKMRLVQQHFRLQLKQRQRIVTQSAVTVKGQKTDISVNLEPIQKVFLCLLLHLHLQPRRLESLIHIQMHMNLKLAELQKKTLQIMYFARLLLQEKVQNSLQMLLIQLVLVKVMAFSSQTRTKYGILKSLLVITTVPLRCLLTKQQSFQTVL